MKKCPDASNIEELEKKLREKMHETDSSIRAVARHSGISKTLLSDFRKGDRNMSFQNLHILASHFGVTYNIKNY